MIYSESVKLLQHLEITPDLMVDVSINYKKTNLYLTINYRHNDINYNCQKIFENNYYDKIKLEEVRHKFDSEDKVKKYFNIGEINE
jgi:hypothetical protein